MRSYCAIYVDVGYLLASAATRVTGTSLRRGVTVDHKALIEALIQQAEEDSGLRLLRVNWYDSGARPGGMPDLHQEEIGLLPKVKLRLGRISHSGEQKGVDLRIGLDLATHGRNHIVDVIYLVSGDDDLTEAVEEAQGHGVQVVVLAVPDHAGRPYAVARHLQREADGLILIGQEAITTTVRPAAIPAALLPGESLEAPSEAEAVDDASKGPVDEETLDLPAVEAVAAEPLTITEAPLELPSEAPAAAVPTPSMLANKRASGLQPPKAPPPASTLTWSTTTGQSPATAEPGISLDLIEIVVRQVVNSWCATATPEALIDLRRGRPFIPGDLDRTLLLDLSGRSGVSDIDDPTRHALRDRFWDLVDRIKLT